MSFSVDVLDSGEFVVLKCTGRLVCGAAVELLRVVVSEQRAEWILLDAEHIEALDAAGLGLLAGLAREACVTGTLFGVVNSSPRVQVMLDVTQLSSVLSLYGLGQVARCARAGSAA